jgi:predicted metal-dependent hydrolase
MRRPRPRPRPPLSLAVGGETLVVEVRESSRARRARIVVRPGRSPEVVVPLGTPEATAIRLLQGHRDWLGRQLQRERENEQRSAVLGLDLPGVVWLHGRAIPVVRPAGTRGTARELAGALRVTGDAAEATDAVTRWYRRAARSALETAVASHAARLGLSPGPVSVRGQRSRWGSCARSGALSFNWRLVVAPEDVLAYVVVHELCHLRRHDHSRAFWALVGRAMPGWETHAQWLREHGTALLAYDPALAVAARAARSATP